MSSTQVLDELFTEVTTDPQEISLQGATYQLRRDLTADEIVEYFSLAAKQDDDGALKLLVGDKDGPKLNKQLRALPQKHMIAAMREIMKVAGLLAESETGE